MSDETKKVEIPEFESAKAEFDAVCEQAYISSRDTIVEELIEGYKKGKREIDIICPCQEASGGNYIGRKIITEFEEKGWSIKFTILDISASESRFSPGIRFIFT